MTYIDKPSILFDPSNLSAFGSLEAVELTPVIQGDFVYGLNTQIWSTPTVSGTGATVDTNLARLRIQSGTGAAGFAYITSKRPIRYRAGQGTVARFTPLFTAGVANNVQFWGMGTISANAISDGYFFGYNGTAFTIAHYNRGTPTFYNQSVWNGDKCDGTTGTSFNFNPIFGTPAMIKYPYLGYGDIEFFLQNPTTGRWVLVHAIRYANTVTTTQLGNPTLSFVGFTLNTGNTTNETMYCGSVGIFISGVRSFVGNPKWAIDSNKAGITTETVLLNIRNATTYNGVLNRGLIRLNSVAWGTAGSGGTNIQTLRFKINATIGGTPVYTPINGTTGDGGVTITSGNSIASFDVAGTTVSGGTYIYNLSNGGSSASTVIDLTPLDLFIAPSEILTISAFATASASCGVSINWSEDV